MRNTRSAPASAAKIVLICCESSLIGRENWREKLTKIASPPTSNRPSAQSTAPTPAVSE